jgi:hypothetical protein
MAENPEDEDNSNEALPARPTYRSGRQQFRRAADFVDADVREAFLLGGYSIDVDADKARFGALLHEQTQRFDKRNQRMRYRAPIMLAVITTLLTIWLNSSYPKAIWDTIRSLMR